MALTRLDNLISSKTGKYLYVSPDDFNASDELNNRGNSPIRPFKSIQRAFIEISRYSYNPGPDNDRFDQFTVMVMPGKHYVDNRPGLASTDGIDAFTFDQAMGEWADSSNLDISDPNNKLYLFNNTEGGAIIPRGSSIIGYDLRRTSVHPLFVPDPADMLEKRSAIFNVTGGCYFWQFTIRDGDLEPSSPLYDSTDGVGKVYYQNGKWNELAVPNFSHHKLTVFEYADKQELSLYYQKIAKAFSQYQPTIDDANEFSDRIEETRIVGPLSDIRAIESIKCTDSSPAQTITVEVTTKVNHGYFKNQFIAIESNGLDDQINGTFGISSLDAVDKRKFSYKIPGTVSALGTTTNLVSGTTYTTANGLNANAVVKAEVDSVESASPYVFNCSIRSTWGICGIWANGLKATGFKSMVIAQYTGVSLQKDDRAFIRYDEFTNTFNQASLTDAFATVPYHTKGDAFWKDDWRNFHVRASEDAFIQCVSIFAVGFADHFLMESGGDMSITNSNSNFGNTSLHAIGHKGYAFNQDKGGYITDIVPPQQVADTTGNTTKQSYYTLDVYASNDVGNHTKIYHGDDQAIDPAKRPAATIGGYRIGAKTDDKLKVKLNPRTAGGNNEFFATIEPSGFKKFTAAADILNPSGVTINNKTLDAADRIEANKDFIAHEAYDRILAKYPALKVKESITITKCRRDVGYLLDATIQDLRLGGNVNTIQAAESYYVGNNLSYITGELTETLEGYNYARDLALAAMRNFTYMRKGVETTSGSSIVNIGDTSGVVEGMTVADYDPSQFTDGKLNSGATRPASPTIPNNTFVKKVIDSTSIELGDNTQTAEKKVFTDRHGNARELILANKTFIATEAYERMLLDFPGYTPSAGYTAVTGKAKCIDDLEKAIAAISENVGYGGNAETWDASDYYTTGAVVDLAAKKDETLAAFNYCKDMSIQVMRKEPVFIYGTHGLTQSSTTASDPITDDPSPELVANRNGDARNLILANKNLIAAEAVERMISTSSTQKFTPSGASYDPSTGDFVITSAAHGLTAATSHTVTGASYTPADGKLILTIAGHGFTNGQKILIKDGSLSLQCAMDGNSTTHAYPRPSDPFSGKWLTISNKQTDTFEVNVGASPQVTYTPTTGTTYNPTTGLMTLKIGNHSLRGSTPHTPSTAAYNPTTGIVTLTIANHGFSVGDKVKLADNSLKFSCGFGGASGAAAEKTYPRSTDPISGKWQEITNVTKDTFDIQVLTTTPSTNTDPHTFVSATTNGLTRAGESIRLAPNSLKFSCGFGGATGTAAEKTYPRSSDPFYNTSLPIESADVDTITVQVLTTIPSTNTDAHTFVSATAGAVQTGGSYAHQYVSATAGGVLAESDSIRIDYEALKFTCAQDGHATQHAYPRVSDPAANKVLPITAKTNDTFTVNVGKSLDKKHNVTDAAYNTSTGDLTLTLNKHNLIKGQSIRLDDGSLTFSCDPGTGVASVAYPRSDTTNLTPTAAAYDPVTGLLTFTLASHGLENNDRIKVTDESLTFRCDEDGQATDKLYPRATDPISGKFIPVSNVTTNTFDIQVLDSAPSTNITTHVCNAIANNAVQRRKDLAYQNSLPITKVGSSFHTATDATYTPKDGILELTVAGHGMSSGDRVKISRDSLVFKCAMDNYGSEHKYPRATDPSDGEWLTISDVTTDKFKVNVGVAGADQQFTPTAGTYDPSSGDLVLTIGTHTLSVGESVTIDNDSLSFTCTMDNNAVAQSYPRAGKDKASSRSLPIIAETDTTITVNVGSAGTNYTYKPTAATYNADTGYMSLTIGQHGLAVGSDITLKDNSLIFTCSKDSNATEHSYPRPGTDPYAGKSLTIESVGSTSHTATDADYNPTTGDLVLTVAGHDFEKPTTYTPTNADYNPTTGIVTLTIANHGLDTGDFVKIADGGLKFKCALDGGNSIKSYPRSTDPASGANLSITKIDNNTFSVQVLAVTPSTNTTAHTFDSVDPNCISHGGDYIQVADDSLTFTCTLDGNTVNKSYPRKGYDDASGKWYQITAVAGNTFTINVGSAGDETAGAHTFVSPAAANGIKKQDGTLTVNVGSAAAEVKTPTAADYNPTTGEMILTIAGHGLSNGSKIRIAKESLKFTCAHGSGTKLYPRATDPVYGKDLTVTVVDVDNIKVQVLATQPSTNVTTHVFTGLENQLTATNADYNAKTGIMTLTVAGHGMVAGERVKIADNSIKLTCAMDGNVAEKTYPRATDPTRDKWVPISNITTDTFDVFVGKSPLKSHTPTAATYNPTTGLMELTIGTHDYVIGDNVKIAKESLIFTCDQDSNATEHAYPRASDPFNDKAFAVTGVTSTTITVQVLSTQPSTNVTAHTFVTALPNAVTAGGDYAHTFVEASANGITRAVVMVGDQYTHTFVKALNAAVEYSPQSAHTWVSAKTNCVKHLPDQTHQFVRAMANGVEKQSGTITVNVGASAAGDQYAHTFVSATPGAVTSGGNYAHTFKSAKTNSVHKTFSIAGNRTYHGQDCIDDVVDLLEAIADNVAYGGNDKTWDAAYSYKTGAHVVGEEKETNIVFEHAKDMAGQVIRKQKILAVGSHGLTQSYGSTITKDTTQNATPEGKFGDAYNLLIDNADLIANEAYARMILNNTGFLPPTGNKQDCIDDIKDFVVEVAHNVGFGGNDRVFDMAQLYVTGAHVAGEEDQTIEAFQDATQLMIQAMRNEKILIVGSHGKTQTFDTTITAAYETPLNNKAADANILLTLNKNFIADVAMARMIANNPSYQPPTGYTQNDCKDDLKDIVDVLAHNVKHGGNDRVWDTANLYVGGAVQGGSIAETVEAINHLRDIAIQVVQNAAVTVVSGSTSLTQVNYPATGTGTGVDGANPKCATESAAITSLTLILTNAISTHSSLASVTRTQSTYKCTTVESAINTLSTIAQNAITNPSSLNGTKASVSTASYNPNTGIMELTVGAHSYKIGEPVSIPNESLVFTCLEDSGNTEHAYPRATDPMGKGVSNITAVTATTISLQVLSSIPSTNTTAHTFVRANDDITVGGVKRTESVGKCQNVRSTIDTLFKIVTDTITIPASLSNVTRNISNGKCQNVASTISTLYGILTNAITTPSSLDLVDRTTSPTGLSTGNAVNSTASTTNTYLYFTLPAGRYTSAYTPNVDDTITQDTAYPQCVSVADTVRQYFANITTIIQTGLNTVTRVQPSSASSNLSSRATIFTLKDWTPGGTSGSNPHQLETGTPVRLVPRPRWNTSTNQYVEVDKRKVRLPNGFDTNTKYYVIAPGRNTQPENYAGTTEFNGSDQKKLMLASSKENAAAGIYIHSAEVDAIDQDIEIDIYQFVLDDKYDLHQYSCTLATAPTGGIQSDVPHIFDIQTSNVEAQKVFLRANVGGSLPTVSTNQQSDTDITNQTTGKILDNKFFYVRYQNAKVFTVHKTHADAISNNSPIAFQPGSYDFSVFADKRQSPMKYNPAHPNAGTNPVVYGKWYLQVKNESESGTSNYDSQSILSRFHDAAYSDASGNNKTNDSWFERLKDDRSADERIYRLRYVIPKYLKSVRDPLNGFSIKMRKDETRKLLPQRLKLKPVAGSITQAKFYNTPDSGQGTEIIGYTDTDFGNIALNLDESKQYDPYKKDTSGNKQYAKNITTKNTYVDMTIESAKFYTENSNTYTEITVVNPRVENVGLKNEIFTTVKVTAPQGGSFVVNATTNTTANAVAWTGNSTGSGYLHAAIQIPGTTTWHLIIKNVSGDIKYSSTDNIRFTQGAVFADLMDYPDYGKSLVLKDLISEKLPQYYYRQNGAKVYTLTPGDVITDDAGVDFYIESVEDIGELDDTFYIFNVEEIQKRIFDQQDGIFYITALRGNHSPYPTGAGNLGNFRNFKFSQPVSKLYPLNYKNDPLWYQVQPNGTRDANIVDPPQTYSAADNYVHGLVTVNDFKGSTTKESVLDMLATEALKHNTYTDVAGPKDNRIRAKEGNASAGAEDRLIPISGDAITVSQKKLYVELRRPSIARAGNHTFEYLGFGPGNYSTGFPARQEVLLTSTQDFYSQSKKQDGGLVFYTGLNSNGDLYIGNRKIDAITGEEEFLERASLQDSADDDDTIGNLVTTFDTPVTFNEYITVNGGEDNDKTSTFNSPVTINVPATVRDTTLGIPTVGVLTSLKVISNVSNTKDDITLDTTNMQKNTATRGNIIIAGNKVSAAIFEWNQRGSDGGGQGYKIQTHSSGTGNLASNITPDQGATYDALQVVNYNSAGGPKSGDMLLKGAYVGSSGSLGWILSNDYKSATGNIQSLTFNGTTTVLLQWKSGITNANAITSGILAGMEIRITNYSDPKLNGTWIVNTGLTNTGNSLTFTINDIVASATTQWSTQSANTTLEVAGSSWKEWGVLGSQTIRTDTQTIGEYKLGVNTVARAAHADYATAFVSAATNPLANLDVVGTAWISGKTIGNFAAHTTLAARTLTPQDHAFMVGGDSATPNNAATFRVSTTNSGRVGINTTKDEMQSALTVKGTSEFTDNAVFQKDVAINGGGPGSSNAADVTTTITDGTVNLFMTTGFVGLTSGTFPANGLKIGGSSRNIEIGNVATASQNIKIGNTSSSSIITIGDTPDGTAGAAISKTTIGGAYSSNESLSFVQIDAKQLKTAGDMQLGTRRGLTDTVKLESTAGTVEFFSGNSATSTLKFGENSSLVTIAGQGGTTTVRNNLIVDGYVRGNSDITLCGGYASYSFTAYRAQVGSVIEPHTSGVLGNNLFNKNVDLINVLRSTAATGELNKIDTAGSGTWGGTGFQATPAGQDPAIFPTLTGDKYYLPLKRTPYDANGFQYYSENDILLIDTAGLGGAQGYNTRATLTLADTANQLAKSTSVGNANSSSLHTGTGTGNSGGFNNSGVDYLWFSGQVDGTNNDERYVILPKIDASNSSANNGVPLARIEIDAFVGNNNNGGEYPDVLGDNSTSETLWAEYSVDADPTLGSATWTPIGEIIPVQGVGQNASNVPNGISTYAIDVPSAAQVSSVAFRLRQPTNTTTGSGNTVASKDDYGLVTLRYKIAVGAGEFVKITRLPQINSTPYYVEVQRQPFGTFTSFHDLHPDTTNIFKCNVQYDSTWLTANVDGTGDQDDIYLAQFGGTLDIGDYVILSRRDLSSPLDNIYDDGEILQLKSTLSQEAKKFSVKNGCGTSSETTVFEINSVTGDTFIFGDTINNGSLTLKGSCTTPYVNATTNKKLTITNGAGVSTFEVDTCTGDTRIGNTHATVFLLAEQYGSTPAAHSLTDTVYTYTHDPQTKQTGGPITSLAGGIIATTSSITLSGYATIGTTAEFPFQVGDLCAIYKQGQIEIIQITATPTVQGSAGSYVWSVPTTNNTTYPNGGRGTTANKVEGTVAQVWTTGSNFVKLNKSTTTTTLLKALAATRAQRVTDGLKARSPNTLDNRLEVQLQNGDIIQPKVDYLQLVRINEEWFDVDSVDGALDAAFAVKLSKQVRIPNTIGTTPVNLYNGGKTTVNDDFVINGGVFRMYGSDSKSIVATIANDEGHVGDGSLTDEVTGQQGLTVHGKGTFYGDLQVRDRDCQTNGTCTDEDVFKVYKETGNTDIGQKFYQKGILSENESASTTLFHIDNLGSAGTGGTAGAKDFRIYQNNAIDSFGIEKYWTGNGGRRHTYVEFDAATGIGQQQTNPLQVNNNYLINTSSGSNMVLYLPDNAQTGDMIRITELSGNLTYNTSLIIRAKKVSGVAVAIQGDTAGSKLDSGSGQSLGVAWDSGELVIQTRNASFGLVYAGSVDIEGSVNAQTIPPGLRGWWLMEL